MILCFDIDGVICNTEGDYPDREPIPEVVDLVNALHRRGHTIKIFTARGSKSGLEWGELTRTQLKKWGLEYDELIMGKPHADWYIDDKMLTVEGLKKMLEDAIVGHAT